MYDKIMFYLLSVLAIATMCLSLYSSTIGKMDQATNQIAWAIMMEIGANRIQDRIEKDKEKKI